MPPCKAARQAFPAVGQAPTCEQRLSVLEAFAATLKNRADELVALHR
jgi:acyl-CoA reductase-like NAD-dependent aldehyde dehydrogenase